MNYTQLTPPRATLLALSALVFQAPLSTHAAAPIGPTGFPLVQGSYVVIDLGNFGGTATAQAYDLNDAPQVVGTATASNGLAYGFFWERGVLRQLPTLAPANGHLENSAARFPFPPKVGPACPTPARGQRCSRTPHGCCG